MTQAWRAIAWSRFDSELLGLDWYRLQTPDSVGLADDLDRLAGRHFWLDARVSQMDREVTDILTQRGGRLICDQLGFAADLSQPAASDDEVTVSSRLLMPEEILERHAANFSYSRFARDPRLPADAAIRLYRSWWETSLGGAKLVSHTGDGAVCTFRIAEGTVEIDLVSILDKRQGLGRRVVRKAMEYGWNNGARRITVRTEADNPAALLYAALGMTQMQSWHLIHLQN